jgi:radical SAM superfamily enzyme YgiQ (UPF0313 family)
MNIYWLNPPLYTRSLYPDVCWINFNTYIPEHNWIQPIIDWESIFEIEQILDDMDKNRVDILCISTYVWNHMLCHEVAKRAKERCPNITVIKGGPFQGYHEDFFEENPYIDYMCYATGHGEMFMKPLLEQIEKYGYAKDKENIPFFIDREHRSNITKTKYVFPETSSIMNNQVYLLNVLSESKRLGKEAIIMYETTRGCPYSCVYCEWGGGISAKVSAKSMEIIKQEMELLSLLGFSSLEIIDANFGILARDVEIAEYIGSLKSKFGAPQKVMLYGLAKTSIEKREKLLDVLYANALLDDYFVALQTTNPEVMKNIKRTDISIEDNLRLARKYREQYDATPSLEFIMGLPGSTMEDFYEEMDYFQQFGSKNCWCKMRNILTLLPDSPANEKSYREKFEIVTAEVGTMENEENYNTIISKSVINKYKSYAVLVVQTYSYTKEEWKQMFFLNRMQRELGPILKAEAKASDFFRYFFDVISKDPYYNKVDRHLSMIVNNEMKDRDIIMMDGLQIEERVMKEYVTENKQLFEQYLHL